MLDLSLFFFQILPAVLVGCFAWNITVFLLKYRKWSEIYYNRKTAKLGPRHPFLGHCNLFNDSASLLALIKNAVYRTRGKFYNGWLLWYPIMGLCHPDTVKILLKSSAPKSKGYAGIYSVFKEWLGDGLLLSDGPKWERNRRLLTPAFHFDVLIPYVKTYNQVVDIFMDNIWKESGTGSSVEIYQPVCLATLDTMLRCALSYEGDIQSRSQTHPYAVAVKQLTALSFNRLMHPTQRYDFVYFNLTRNGRKCRRYIDYVHDFADEIILRRQKQLELDPSQLKKRRLDFLDILLTAKDETGQGLSNMDIRAEVDTFLFEGHDTTASAISWAIYALAKYPEEQQKVADEALAVTSTENYTDWEDLPKLRHLNLFIREVLRMYSPVPFIGRNMDKDYHFDGIKIPQQFNMDICIASLHHHPDIYPDHEVFRPDRFNEENSAQRDPYAFIPFSAGPRNCIGQNFAMHEMKVFISRLVKRFKVHLNENHVVEEVPEAVMRARNGIKITLEERFNQNTNE